MHQVRVTDSRGADVDLTSTVASEPSGWWCRDHNRPTSQCGGRTRGATLDLGPDPAPSCAGSWHYAIPSTTVIDGMHGDVSHAADRVGLSDVLPEEHADVLAMIDPHGELLSYYRHLRMAVHPKRFADPTEREHLRNRLEAILRSMVMRELRDSTRPSTNEERGWTVSPLRYFGLWLWLNAPCWLFGHRRFRKLLYCANCGKERA